MLDFLLVAAWGIGLAGAGFAAGVLWERNRRKPPPPDGNGDGAREAVRRAAL